MSHPLIPCTGVVPSCPMHGGSYPMIQRQVCSVVIVLSCAMCSVVLCIADEPQGIERLSGANENDILPRTQDVVSLNSSEEQHSGDTGTFVTNADGEAENSDKGLGDVLPEFSGWNRSPPRLPFSRRLPLLPLR